MFCRPQCQLETRSLVWKRNDGVSIDVCRGLVHFLSQCVQIEHREEYRRTHRDVSHLGRDSYRDIRGDVSLIRYGYYNEDFGEMCGSYCGFR